MEAVAELSTKDKFLSGLSPVQEVHPHLAGVRNNAAEALQQLDFPTSKTEAWKYTRVGSITKKEYNNNPVTIDDISSFLIPGLEASIVVLVNGRYVKELSDIKQENRVVVKSLAEAKQTHPNVFEDHFGNYVNSDTNIFTATNTAYHEDGVFVYVENGAANDLPIHVINISTGETALALPRTLFVVGDNSSAKAIFSYHSLNAQDVLTNNVVEYVLQQNARLQVYEVQDENETCSQIKYTKAFQARNSFFDITTITLGGKLVRNNLDIELDDEGCESRLYGLYIPQGKEHVDNQTIVHHKKPNCMSDELYRGIVDDKATAVFNGKVFVYKDAQKTNAYQQNNNILLTDDATVRSKPELEIYADDVKCSHGSTTGQLDEDAMFYLRSRGIGMSSARNLLIKAFSADVLDNIAIEPLKALVEERIDKRFGV